MTTQNFIFSMKSYDAETLSNQVAWMLEKRTELASRKKFPGLWKLTDKLNSVKRTQSAEEKHRRESRRRFGGLFLVMGIFLFVPGIIQPKELPGPLVVGLLAILLGAWYLQRDDRKEAGFEKKAKKLLESNNASMKNQKLRLVFSETELALSGAGEDKRISYDSIECVLKTADLFGLIYDNQLVLLQKKELLLGTTEEFEKRLEEKVHVYKNTEK